MQRRLLRTLQVQRFVFLFPEVVMRGVLILCVFRDRLAESIGPVMAFKAVPAAIRAFTDVALDKQTQVGVHPEDFDLLKIAEVDDESGSVIPCDPPEVLLTGASWLAMQGTRDVPPDDGGQLSLLRKEA